LGTLVGSAERGYLAFLYADGNEIGRLLQKLTSPEQYQAVSQALAEGTREALYGALDAVCKGLPDEGYWPFDIVNIGGDDVTVLVQAGYAWELGVEFLRRFEQEIKGRLQKALGSWPQGWPDTVTASCGIAIADAKYPVRYLERLAADLLKSAKKVAKKSQGAPKSAITFLWLPTPVAADKAEPLQSYYVRRHPADWRCELASRPYDLAQAQTILSCSLAMAAWPRALRHRWAEALERGVLTSANLIHYDIARRTEKKQKGMYEILLQLGTLAAPDRDPTNKAAPIWHRIKDGNTIVYRTALVDALELAELQAMRPGVEEEEER